MALFKKDTSPFFNELNMTGIIMPDLSRSNKLTGGSRHLNVDNYEALIRQAFGLLDRRGRKQDVPENLTGVILRLNSPGGAVTQSEALLDLLCSCRAESGVPLYIFGEDLLASGGYMMALAGDKISVMPSTVTGSIGVVASYGIAGMGLENLADRWGLTDRTRTAGGSKRRNITNPFLRPTEEDEASVKKKLDRLHAKFIAKVTERRGEKLDRARLDEIFSGDTWDGDEAVKLGLADDVAYPNQLSPEIRREVIRPKKQSPFAALMEARMPAGMQLDAESLVAASVAELERQQMRSFMPMAIMR